MLVNDKPYTKSNKWRASVKYLIMPVPKLIFTSYMIIHHTKKSQMSAFKKGIHNNIAYVASRRWWYAKVTISEKKSHESQFGILPILV